MQLSPATPPEPAKPIAANTLSLEDAEGDHGEQLPSPDADADGGAPAPVRGWRMGLVVTASALCGGIAVVLWNRHMLARMREPHDASHEPGAGDWEDEG